MLLLEVLSGIYRHTIQHFNFDWYTLKREYLYRQFLGNKLGLNSLPKSFTVSPRNSLLKEIQASYLFIDPTTYSSEITREFLYKNSSFLHYLFIKDFLKVTNNVFLHLNINFDSLSNYFVQLLGLIWLQSLSKLKFIQVSIDQWKSVVNGFVCRQRTQLLCQQVDYIS